MHPLGSNSKLFENLYPDTEVREEKVIVKDIRRLGGAISLAVMAVMYSSQYVRAEQQLNHCGDFTGEGISCYNGVLEYALWDLDIQQLEHFLVDDFVGLGEYDEVANEIEFNLHYLNHAKNPDFQKRIFPILLTLKSYTGHEFKGEDLLPFVRFDLYMQNGERDKAMDELRFIIDGYPVFPSMQEAFENMGLLPTEV